MIFISLQFIKPIISHFITLNFAVNLLFEKQRLLNPRLLTWKLYNHKKKLIAWLSDYSDYITQHYGITTLWTCNCHIYNWFSVLKRILLTPKQIVNERVNLPCIIYGGKIIINRKTINFNATVKKNMQFLW